MKPFTLNRIRSPDQPGSSASRRARAARARSKTRAVAGQAAAGVGGHDDGVELEGVAVGVGDPGRGRLADQLRHPGVEGGGDRVADRAGPVVELARGGAPEAAAGEAVEVVEVVLGHRPQAGRAVGGVARGLEHHRDEAVARRRRPSPAAGPAWSRSGGRGRSCSSPGRSARRPIVRPSSPSTEARSTARSRIAARVRSPLVALALAIPRDI